jgi:hypothetical protein
MLPTKTAIALAEASQLKDIFKDPLLWKQHIGIFQRLSLVADYDTAIRGVTPYIHRKLTPEDSTVFTLLYGMAKKDVLGLAVEALLEVAETSKSHKEKIAAAAVLNELYGDKDLVKDVSLTDRLIVNLVGNSES